MTANYKGIIERWVKGGWNGGNLNLVDELYSVDYELHDPTSPAPIKGQAAFKSFVSSFLSALPDIQFTVGDMIQDGDKVAWRWIGTGTHRGELMGIAPTYKSATITGIVISRFENGKWQEDYLNFDLLGMLQQFGVIPA